MSTAFDDAWLLRRVTDLASVEFAGVDARIGWKVQTGTRAFATFVDVVASGRLVDVVDSDRDGPEADVLLELPVDVFDAIQAGSLDVAVAFMRGDLRLTGDRAVFFALVPAMRGGEYLDATSGVAAPLGDR